jgi:hypothetical protein
VTSFFVPPGNSRDCYTCSKAADKGKSPLSPLQ